MAWGAGFLDMGQGAASAPRFRVGLDDLYSAPPSVQYPEAPQPIDTFGELSPAEQSRLRREALLRAAFAIGSASSNGQYGTALSGAALENERTRQSVIEEAEKRQQQEYALARQQAEEQAQQQARQIAEDDKKEQAQALLGMYQRVVDADPELADRAEVALRSRSMQGLASLFEEVPKRQALRDRGLDPDDPVGLDEWEAKQKQAREIEMIREREKIQLDYLDDEERIKNDAEVARQQQLRAQGLGSYFRHPQDAAAAAGEQAKRWKPDMIKLNGEWWIADMNIMDPNTGQPKVYRTTLPADKEYEIRGDQKRGYYAVDKQNPKSVLQVPIPAGYGPPAASPSPSSSAAPPASVVTDPAKVPGNRGTKSRSPLRGETTEQSLERKLREARGALGAMTPEQEAHARRLLTTMKVEDYVAQVRKVRGR